MQKKHILVLSLLAAGIAIELILMAGMMTVRGNSEQTLSTNSTSIARGENNNLPTGEPGGLMMPPEEGYPLMDEDMAGGVPDFGEEATPIFPPTVEGGDGGGYSWPGGETTGSTDDTDSSWNSGYPASDPYNYPDESYPLPPTQPAGPQDPWPTDVPAATEAPTGTAPAPTNTFPAQPTHTLAPEVPTQTAQPVQPTQAATAAPTAPPSVPAPSGGLVSMPASAPAVDGAGSDPAWAAAPAVEINVNGGANHGSTNITARSVYEGDSVYFLFTWEDPTQSFLRFPWERQADGSWKLLASPERGLNDENVYYEDKLALLWPVRGMADFTSAGCGTACHAGENADAKPYGNMYTPGEDSRADLWQWKSVRNAGQLDDEYMDSTRYSQDNPAAGVHPDPNDGGGYRGNQNKDKNAPAYMPRDGGQKNGAPGFISEAEKVDLDPRLFKPGERVPSVLTEPWKGDRGDIQAAWQYKDGRWTLELRRKLVTGSAYDVQFDDPNKVYSFGIAAFDNAQVRHAYQTGATTFRFQR